MKLLGHETVVKNSTFKNIGSFRSVLIDFDMTTRFSKISFNY